MDNTWEIIDNIEENELSDKKLSDNLSLPKNNIVYIKNDKPLTVNTLLANEISSENITTNNNNTTINNDTTNNNNTTINNTTNNNTTNNNTKLINDDNKINSYQNTYDWTASPQFSSSSESDNDSESQIHEETLLINNESTNKGLAKKNKNFYNNIMKTIFVSCMFILGGITIYIYKERLMFS